MPGTAPADRIRVRAVGNNVRLIDEHLEAMRRDANGLEYAPWKREVDALWRRTFQQISRMSPGPQREALETIREPWTAYITHYAVTDTSQRGR